jgi:hypothetical protein
VPIEPGGWSVFEWRERDDSDRVGSTVWSLFNKDTTYFGPGESAFMLNYRVDDLDGLIAKLRAEGVDVPDERHQDENGASRGSPTPGVGAPDGAGAPGSSHRALGARPGSLTAT